jgi:hypothetical protein
MATKLEKYYKTIPKVFKPTVNPVINALLQAFAEADEEISTQIDNTKAQLFVRTANGRFLDKLANSLGVSRPVDIGLSDSQFQELIPNLSLKHKQIRKTLYDTMDVFWGPLFSRANVTSNNVAPFDVSLGDVIKLMVDGGNVQTIKAVTGDIATNGAATAEEIVALINKGTGLTASVIVDPLTGDDSVNIRTNTPGPIGSIEVVDSTMIDPTKLDLSIGKYELRQQDQRVSIYEIRPNEIIIELPAIVPALRRTLKGSHHFHEDETLETTWVGSFFYNDGGLTTYNVSGEESFIEEPLVKGQVYVKVTVDDASVITSQSGTLIFDWGGENEEVGVRFRGVPNDKTILLDPSYVFQKTHNTNEKVNVLNDLLEVKPQINGDDYAIYMNDPVAARTVVEQLLRDLTAAGIIVTFVVLAPDFKYIIDSPYLTTDDALGEN